MIKDVKTTTVWNQYESAEINHEILNKPIKNQSPQMSTNTDQSNGSDDSTEGKIEKKQVVSNPNHSIRLKISSKKKKNYNIPSFVISHQDP